jgi:hypothetical protein
MDALYLSSGITIVAQLAHRVIAGHSVNAADPAFESIVEIVKHSKRDLEVLPVRTA